MWNGAGQPVVYAFRVAFFREFAKLHPDCVLGIGKDYWQLYDCVDGVLGEDLDCWCCDECQSLVVFSDNLRYDFIQMRELPEISTSDVASWEEYIAFRDWDYEKFMDYSEGRHPLQAIEIYPFKCRYRLSPDKKTICAFDADGTLQFGYRQIKCIVF